MNVEKYLIGILPEGADILRPDIMFADDSISVLESLQRLFKDEPYHRFASDNREVLSVIKTSVENRHEKLQKGKR